MSGRLDILFQRRQGRLVVRQVCGLDWDVWGRVWGDEQAVGAGRKRWEKISVWT